LRIDKQIHDASNTSRQFGYLCASSGYRTIDQHEFDKGPSRFFIMDWALLLIYGNRKVLNGLPGKGMGSGLVCIGMVAGQKCNTWTPLNQGNVNMDKHEVNVAKHGRTTGWTFGTINACLTKIDLKADQQWDGMAKEHGISETHLTDCYRIVDRSHKRDFLEAGDSGSIVLHQNSGTWLGLLFG
jgi:hypothetical protein